MQSLDDIALLREYAERGTEAAFATLVTRHIDRVYSVALRHTRSPHSAEEITQAVFVILARKSRQLRQDVILAGWLYQTARLTAITHIRSESRRARREQEAVMQTLSDENQSDVWSKITPLLDAALADLSDTDRNAVVLRFFYGRSMGEIGTALGASEDSARMRVNRALEKLHTYFSRHGVNSTAETIADAISANSTQAAPLALAETVTATALAKGATASTSILTLIKGALKIMAWTKMKTAVVASGVILLAIGTTVAVVKAKNRVSRKDDFVAYEIQHQSLMQKLFPAGDDETRRQLKGNWIITDKRFQGNPRFTHYPNNYPHFKTWTLTNWAIVTYNSKSNITYSASGPYEIHGDVYTETVESGTGTMSNYIGTRMQYQLRVKGDRYYQMGGGIEETGQRVSQ